MDFAGKPRAYEDVMAAWRTSFPRLTIWEDAVDRGFVTRESDGTIGSVISVTDKGRLLLREDGRL